MFRAAPTEVSLAEVLCGAGWDVEGQGFLPLSPGPHGGEGIDSRVTGTFGHTDFLSFHRVLKRTGGNECYSHGRSDLVYQVWMLLSYLALDST